MTINPSDFKPQGKPSKEAVKAVWDVTPQASARKVAAILQNRGFEISFRTVIRWCNNNWQESKAANHDPAASGRAVPPSVRTALRSQIEKIPQTTKDGAEQMANGNVPPLMSIADEEKLLLARRDELMVMSEADLDIVEAKARRVMNILMMESAGKRANVMVLIPKDTGHFVAAMTDARRVMGTGTIDAPPGAPRYGDKPGDVLELTANPPNATVSAIDKFLREEELTS